MACLPDSAAARWLFAALMGLATSGPAHAVSIAYQAIAISGDPVAGGATGETYFSLSTPVVNASGDVAFQARVRLAVQGVQTERVVMAPGGAGALTVVARENQPIPGGGAATITGFGVFDPNIDAHGGVALRATLTGNVDAAVATDGAGGIAIAALEGNPAPSTGAEYGFFQAPGIAGNGQLSLPMALVGSGVTAANDHALFTGTAGALALLVREGDPVTGAPVGVRVGPLPGSPLSVDVNALGQAAFSTTLTGAGVTAADDEAVLGPTPSAALGIVAREGGAAAGFGPSVTWRPDTSLLTDGGVVFTAGLSGPGITPDQDFVLYAQDSSTGAIAPLVVEGDTATGLPAGVVIESFSNLSTNDVGGVAFTARLRGPGRRNALVVADPTDITLIAREGDPVPGLPGFTLLGPRAAGLSDAGHAVFDSLLFDPSIGDVTGNGVFLKPSGEDLQALAIPGQLLEVSPGVFKTVADAAVWSGIRAEQGRTAIGGDHAAFMAFFTDGTTAVMLATVPEPRAALLLALAFGAARRARARLR